MLNLKSVKHLAKWLNTSPAELKSGTREADFEQLELIDPRRPGKKRIVLNVKGETRRLQTLLYRRILKKRLTANVCSHGCVAGRDIKTNVHSHRRSRFLFQADITDFYPSVDFSRVYLSLIHI